MSHPSLQASALAAGVAADLPQLTSTHTKMFPEALLGAMLERGYCSGEAEALLSVVTQIVKK